MSTNPYHSASFPEIQSLIAQLGLALKHMLIILERLPITRYDSREKALPTDVDVPEGHLVATLSKTLLNQWIRSLETLVERCRDIETQDKRA